MNGQNAEFIQERLEEALTADRIRLEPGERITVSTIEVCDACRRPSLDCPDGGACPVCDGLSWVRRHFSVIG